MADDINIVISVDDKDVIRARKHQNKLQSAVAQLEREFRKGNITAAKHRSELNKQAAALGKLGGGYRKAMSEVNSYASALKKATAAQVAQAQATAMAKNRTNKFGMVSQQVGYQVGDFFVQIQSGTSALVAFGQQGTQLAGLLPGMQGAVIGITLAVGTMLLRTMQQAKDAEKTIMSFAKALKTVKKETSELRRENEAFLAGYDSKETFAIVEGIKTQADELRRLKDVLRGYSSMKSDVNAVGESTKDRSIAQWIIDSGKGLVQALGGGSVQEAKNILDSRIVKQVKIIKDAEKTLQEAIDEMLKARDRKDEIRNRERLAKNRMSGLFALSEAWQRESYKNSDLANERKLISYEEDSKKELLEQKAKDMFNWAMSFSEASDNMLYGKSRARKLQLIKDEKNAELKEQQRLAKVQFNWAMSFSQAYDDAFYAKARARRLQLAEEEKKELERQAKVAFERAMSFSQAYSTMLFNAKKKQAAKEKSILMGKYSDAYSGRDLADASFAQGSEELRVAEERIKLLEIENKYGEESIELHRAITKSELESLRYNQINNGLSVTMNKELEKTLLKYRAILFISKEQQKLNEDRKDFEDSMADTLESGFMSMIDGTTSVTDAFRSMARDVIKELYRILVVQQIVNQAKGAITSLSGAVFPSASSSVPNYGPPTVQANGNAFNNGKIIPYANGGVVGYPTMFPMSGGKTGLMGEAGPEAILPLKRGPNGKLGVESSGGSVVVNQTINVSTGVAQTVRNEIRTLMPQIAEGAKSAVLDAKRRGGSFGSAFA